MATITVAQLLKAMKEQAISTLLRNALQSNLEKHGVG